MSDVDKAWDFLKAVQHAMRLEGIPEESFEHVNNRLVYGDHHSHKARNAASEQKIQVHISGAPMSADRMHAAAVEHYNRRMADINRRPATR